MLLRRNTQVRLKGSVLKTDRGLTARGGSNPSSSAIFILILLSRDGAVVARRAHNPEVVGSNPTPAIILFILDFSSKYDILKIEAP